jgi:hypothetical protein
MEQLDISNREKLTKKEMHPYEHKWKDGRKNYKSGRKKKRKTLDRL